MKQTILKDGKVMLIPSGGERIIREGHKRLSGKVILPSVEEASKWHVATDEEVRVYSRKEAHNG